MTCVIGTLPRERRRAQPLVVTVEWELDATRAAVAADLAHSVDYARVAEEVREILELARFQLLESAALALCHYLLSLPGPLVARVSLRKPAALGGVGFPVVTVERARDEVTIAGKRIFECPDAKIERVGDSLKVTTP